jgi:hypothetical protein
MCKIHGRLSSEGRDSAKGRLGYLRRDWYKLIGYLRRDWSLRVGIAVLLLAIVSYLSGAMLLYFVSLYPGFPTREYPSENVLNLINAYNQYTTTLFSFVNLAIALVTGLAHFGNRPRPDLRFLCAALITAFIGFAQYLWIVQYYIGWASPGTWKYLPYDLSMPSYSFGLVLIAVLASLVIALIGIWNTSKPSAC